MTRKIVALAVTAAFVACGAAAQYQGQEKREIKALSAGEIQGYLSGAGMGFAKPAELNHYPGPKHVLELEEQLGLTQTQREQVQQSFDRMHERAVLLGKQLVDMERRLDVMFADGKAVPEALHKLVLETAEVRGELRYVHLKAHTDMKTVLTSEQVADYDRLRGYTPH